MRPLRKEEYDLIAVILKDQPNSEYLIEQLNHALVTDMNDGGMGSLRFYNIENRVFGKEIGGIDWKDVDGTPVFFDVYIDNKGDLFELDSFKGDFSKLISFPVSPYPPINKRL